MAVLFFLVASFLVNFVLGFVVSKVEKNKGWVDGHTPKGIYEKHIKRPLDFAIALSALVLFWPVLLIVALAVRVKMGKPVVFTQERPGLGGKIFVLRKFCSMTNEKDSDGNLLPDEQRLTAFGRWMRKISIDESLELWNILRGDISIVGPRPLLKEYLPYYSEEEAHRHDVRPGLTGLAQVNGRNNLDWDKRFAMDVLYTENITFSGDVKILLKTVGKVLSRADVLEDTSKGETNFAEERKAGKI